MSRALTRIVSWGHDLLSEVLSAGDLAVDLTAGNGYDALFLARLVGGAGQVVAFDNQPEALEKTCQRLQAAGYSPRWRGGEPIRLPRERGIDLVLSGHEQLAEYLSAPPRVVVANLGYLPGGDPRFVTRSDSTVQALSQAGQLLSGGGRMAVVVYPGHPGGTEEGQAVSEFFATLDKNCFQVLQLTVLNSSQAPFLLAAEKIQ